MVLVAKSNEISRNGRIHLSINDRLITIFRDRNSGKLTAIDAVCHHAAGPLTNGHLEDIEDLNVTVVVCPHHKYMVSIHDGTKIYQAVNIVDGKPEVGGWTKGKVVQRVHQVTELSNGEIHVELNEEDVIFPSDSDSQSKYCAQFFEIHSVHRSR